jgi:hypothetical protein
MLTALVRPFVPGLLSKNSPTVTITKRACSSSLRCGGCGIGGLLFCPPTRPINGANISVLDGLVFSSWTSKLRNPCHLELQFVGEVHGNSVALNGHIYSTQRLSKDF